MEELDTSNDSSEVPQILIVDDRQENLLALDATLDMLDANIIQALSGQDALAVLLENDIALVLLDVQMPDMDGYEVASIMNESPSTANIPIIFITATSIEEHFVKRGYNVGAVDYISKPLNTEILLSKVTVFLQLWTQSNELKLLSQKYQDALVEITRQRDELNHLALRDHLTGLYQRRAFDELLIKEISKTVRYRTFLSIAMLDLDHFKAVNDNYGHAVGDDVLVKSAREFIHSVRTSDVVCRFGGEEFVILMPDTQLYDASLCCERIRQAIDDLKISTEKGELHITLSIGVAEFQLQSEKKPEELMKRADECLYKAKNNGRNQVYPKSITTLK